ncbi:hypothetical protein BTVI_106578 [Pitangus sulphuratus]|nr:hypothetical protein BTVI_106578 [Pitangus sulphuratus]
MLLLKICDPERNLTLERDGSEAVKVCISIGKTLGICKFKNVKDSTIPGMHPPFAEVNFGTTDILQLNNKWPKDCPFNVDQRTSNVLLTLEVIERAHVFVTGTRKIYSYLQYRIRLDILLENSKFNYRYAYVHRPKEKCSIPLGVTLVDSLDSLTPLLSCAEDSRSGCNTSGRVSSEWSREAESLPCPADHAASNAAEATFGFLGYKCKLLAHVQPLIHQQCAVAQVTAQGSYEDRKQR